MCGSFKRNEDESAVFGKYEYEKIIFLCNAILPTRRNYIHIWVFWYSSMHVMYKIRNKVDVSEERKGVEEVAKCRLRSTRSNWNYYMVAYVIAIYSLVGWGELHENVQRFGRIVSPWRRYREESLNGCFVVGVVRCLVQRVRRYSFSSYARRLECTRVVPNVARYVHFNRDYDSGLG